MLYFSYLSEVSHESQVISNSNLLAKFELHSIDEFNHRDYF